MEWNGFQIFQRADTPFGILSGQKIIVTGGGIDPITGRNHLVGGQSRDDVLYDFSLIETQLAGMSAIDVELKSRIVEILRREYVTHSRQAPDLAGESLSDGVISIQIRSADLDIDRSRQSHVQNRIHEPTGLQVRAQVRQVRLNPAADTTHIVDTGNAMAFVQS